MKRLILLAALILCPLGLRAQAPLGGISGVSSGAYDCSGYDLVCQNFETPGTGYDNGETWSTSGSPTSVDPADSTNPAPLYGTQSLDVVGASGANNNGGVSVSFTPTTHVYGFVAVHPVTTTTGSANLTLFNITDTGGAHCLECVFLNGSSGYTLAEYTTGESGHTSSYSVSDGITYYIWFEYQAGTGSNGLIRIYISTTTTKPASPTISVTNSTATADAAELQLVGSDSTEWVEDRALACSAATCPGGIGSNP